MYVHAGLPSSCSLGLLDKSAFSERQTVQCGKCTCELNVYLDNAGLRSTLLLMKQFESVATLCNIIVGE